VPEDVHVDTRTFAATFVIGMSMFATLFLGVVLAVFLTLGAVSGDAERGLLQPLVVRPIGRRSMLLARFLAAAGVCAVYVFVVYIVSVVITGTEGGWWPQDIATPGLLLAFAVVVMTAMSLLGSVFLGATANGIAIFMLFIGGLVAGLLGTIAHALGSQTISHWATIAAYALPFEALYQDALKQVTLGTHGFTSFLLRLGPFGGSYNSGWGVRLWAAAYLVAVGAAATTAFARRDLERFGSGSRPRQTRRPGTRSTSNHRLQPGKPRRNPQRSARTSTRFRPCSMRRPGRERVWGSGK
jgi:ABC-type transport system involved in multi-copper enzyme maturation permease subunit